MDPPVVNVFLATRLERANTAKQQFVAVSSGGFLIANVGQIYFQKGVSVMKHIKRKRKWPVWLAIMLVMMMGFAGLAPPLPSTVASSGTVGANPPPFDFSDSFYLA